MFFDDTVDSLLGDLKKTADKLLVLHTDKAQRAEYLEAKAKETAEEAGRALRVGTKLNALIS